MAAPRAHGNRRRKRKGPARFRCHPASGFARQAAISGGGVSLGRTSGRGSARGLAAPAGMSRVPLGKVLLRNVIRHTDAHNKIQEESEMWKIREWEKQTQETYERKQRRILSDTSSSRMRSDGFDEESQRADWKTKNFAHIPDVIEEDFLRARSWNKKLYECEANMPDRWGHSGYKELYPEEFDTDSDQQEDEHGAVNGKKKLSLGKQSAHKSRKRKKEKKSHKKKQKKRSHKKQKKKKREQAQASSDSSLESECSQEGASGTKKGKRRHKKKSKKVPARNPASSSGQESDSSHPSSSATSSSEESECEEKRKKRPKKRRKKQHTSPSEKHSEIQEKRSKRKNWKVAADEKSEESSDED